MKIEIALNKQSIKKAKKQLLYVKKILPTMQKEFLEYVALWLIERANNYLNVSDIGENVKIDIRNGWEYDFTANGVKITNRTEKAVFVEFGVGVVGQSQEHPNATAEGYEYNVNSPYKSADGSWSFWLNSEERDLPMSAFSDFGTYDDHREGGKRMVVTTFGAKGVWYAYNAIVDAKMEIEKVGGGEIGKLWNDVKKRYIK
jgi:hypothetical protein